MFHRSLSTKKEDKPEFSEQSLDNQEEKDG